MTNVTVDVIYSMDNKILPKILEVIDTEDSDFTLERQQYWRQFYEDVYVYFDVDLIKDSNKNSMI